MSTTKPWLANYPNGVPANINPDAYTALIDMILETFDKYRKKDAFTCMDKSLTFDQIDKYSEAFGAYLQSRGLEKGDRIALMSPTISYCFVWSNACRNYRCKYQSSLYN